MSFDKINLPDFMLAELYKEGLVVIDNDINLLKKTDAKPEIPAAKEITAAAPPQPLIPPKPAGASLSYLGSNAKNIAILVNDGAAIHLQDDLLELLSKILEACKLNLADVAIINTFHQQLDDQRLRKELAPSLTVLFGIETTAIELPFSIPDYKVQQFNNCAYIQAPSLEKMRGTSTEARLEKSKLWACLKTHFGI